MRLSKHGCNVLDSRVFLRIFIKVIEYFFRVYIASSNKSGIRKFLNVFKPSSVSRVCRTVSRKEGHWENVD